MAFRIIPTCTGCTACLKVCPTQAISGSRKQLHVIDPVVCIECGACGLICPAGAVLDAGDAVCAFVKRSQWPRPVILEEECVSCNACLQACPVNVLGTTILLSMELSHGSTPPPAPPQNRGGEIEESGIFGSKSLPKIPVPLVSASFPLRIGAQGYGSSERALNGPYHPIPYLRNEKACIGCAFCEQACPVRAIRMSVPLAVNAAS